MAHLPKEILPRTQQLIMTGNDLGTIEVVNDSLSSISMFDLQNCQVTDISENALKMLFSYADSLKLSANKITRLSDTFSSSVSNTKLWLSNNPFECSCNTLWMRDWLQNAPNVMDKENITCGSGKWTGKFYF